MKTFPQILLGTVLLSGLAFAVIGCVTSGSVEVSDGYYYGPGYRDPWFRGGASGNHERMSSMKSRHATSPSTTL